MWTEGCIIMLLIFLFGLAASVDNDLPYRASLPEPWDTYSGEEIPLEESE